jgi:SprT protein
VLQESSIQEILHKHVPQVTYSYCLQLWQRHPFDFRLRKRRISKAGDFTCHHGRVPRITINHDLPSLEFLLTYVHEVAHLHVHQQHGFRAEAHGEEWKKSFQQLLHPLLGEHIFPEPVLSCLKQHMINPKASTYSDSTLTKLLRSRDPRAAKTTLLSDLPEGSVFDLHGRWFKKGKLKRTRVLCQEIKSKRQYLVPADAPVGSAQLSFL